MAGCQVPWYEKYAADFAQSPGECYYGAHHSPQSYGYDQPPDYPGGYDPVPEAHSPGIQCPSSPQPLEYYQSPVSPPRGPRLWRFYPPQLERAGGAGPAFESQPWVSPSRPPRPPPIPPTPRSPCHSYYGPAPFGEGEVPYLGHRYHKEEELMVPYGTSLCPWGQSGLPMRPYMTPKKPQFSSRRRTGDPSRKERKRLNFRTKWAQEPTAYPPKHVCSPVQENCSAPPTVRPRLPPQNTRRGCGIPRLAPPETRRASAIPIPRRTQPTQSEVGQRRCIGPLARPRR